jgi:hypothetical protein
MTKLYLKFELVTSHKKLSFLFSKSQLSWYEKKEEATDPPFRKSNMRIKL